MQNERKLNVLQTLTIYLFVLIAGVVVFAFFSGCEKTTDAIIAETHTDIGEALLDTKTRTEEAFNEGSITKETYRQIRTNWLRAKELYIDLTPLAMGYIENNGNYDTDKIFEAISQLQIIVKDLEVWLNET